MRGQQYLTIHDKLRDRRISTFQELHDAIFNLYGLVNCPGWSTFWFMTLGEVWGDFSISKDDKIKRVLLEEVLYKMDELIDSIRDIQERGFK